MAKFHELLETILRDRKITPNEVAVIRDYIQENGELDLADVRFLTELLSGATEVCTEFDEIFFPVLKAVVLKDGKIGQDEQFFLLKMLYSDGVIRDVERVFLEELRRDADEVSPEFGALYETALAAPATNWDLGGR